MKKVILLIDEDSAIIRLLKSRLADFYEVETADDGQAGYYAIYDRKPAAVLLGLSIKKMEPAALMGRIRAQKRFGSLPFYVFADSLPNDMADQALAAGAADAFSKSDPVFVNQVVEVLSDYFKPLVRVRRGRETALAETSLVMPGGSTALLANPPSVPEVQIAALPGRPRVSEPVAQKRSEKVLAPLECLIPEDSEGAVDDATQLRQLFAENMGRRVHAARKAFVVYTTVSDNASRVSSFESFYKGVASLRAEAAQCELKGLVRLLDPLEARAKQIRDDLEKEEYPSAATLQVIANAIDLLVAMSHQSSELDILNRFSPVALVVDDESVSRKAITLGLKKAQIGVTAVETGEAAIKECEIAEFDLILLDVEMPGMNGFALCARIRSAPKHRDIPVLFISALDDLRSRASARISGGNQFVRKPVNFLELSITATTLLLKQRLKEIDNLVLSTYEKPANDTELLR